VSKPRDIVRRIQREAKSQGMEFVKLREGANHTVYDLDGVKIPIPRHREIGEGLTEEIYRECQDKLGKGWWRR
jgi:hypothetical protein